LFGHTQLEPLRNTPIALPPSIPLDPLRNLIYEIKPAP
jgi:hypothetical protein